MCWIVISELCEYFAVQQWLPESVSVTVLFDVSDNVE